MTDIYSRLNSDHDKHRALLDLVALTEGDSAVRKELFERLVRELRAHANAEERTLYAQMLGRKESQPKASHSVHEHEVLDQLIAELLETDRSSAGWIVTFRKLREEALHHMEEEEKDTFVAGREVISEEEAERLAEEFDREKAQELKTVSVSS